MLCGEFYYYFPSMNPLFVTIFFRNCEEALGVLGLEGSLKSTWWRPNFSLNIEKKDNEKKNLSRVIHYNYFDGFSYLGGHGLG